MKTVSWWWLWRKRACPQQRKLFVKTFGRWKRVPITAENLRIAAEVGLSLWWLGNRTFPRISDMTNYVRYDRALHTFPRDYALMAEALNR